MKLSCTRDNLYRGLSITSHSGGKNVDLPILGNVLLKASDGSLKLTATNLEIASSCLVRGKVDEDGEFTVPAKLFFDYVSLLPSEQVDLHVVDRILHVRCGGHSTKMNGLPASEFPLVPPVAEGVSFKLPAEGLRQAIGQVLFAVAANEARPELSGVCVKFNDPSAGAGKATLAATDSYRLAERLVDATGPSDPRTVIIPARTLSEVGRIISVSKDDVDSPEVVEFVLADNQMLVRIGSVELMSRTIDGRYPDYRQIVPTAFKTEAVVEANALSKAVKTASLFSRTGLFDVKLELSAKDKSITVKGADTARGENVVVCPADISGDDNAVTVNYRYLLDGLSACGSPEVNVQMIDAMNPCLVTPKTEAGKSGYLYIVMPIKQ